MNLKPTDVRPGNTLRSHLTQELVEVDWLVIKHLEDGNIQSGYTPNVPVYEPIPLTRELMLKSGFKVFGSDGFISLEAFSPGHPSQRFDIDWSERTGIMVKSRYQADADHFFMRHIEHIHQLQNLYFALTSEELPIKI